MPKSRWDAPNYMNITGNSTVVNVGAPVFLKDIRKKLTVSSVNYEFVIPGSAPLDLEEFLAQFVVSTENGTSQTVALSLQGCLDPLDSYTQINMANGIDTDDTTITVDDGASIGSSTVAIPALLAKFTDSGDPRTLEAYEWVMITSISTNDLTVTRGIFGTSGQSFSDNDFLFYSNSWFTLKDSGGNDITDATFSSDGATAAAPKIKQFALSQEGLDGLPTPAIRLHQAAPNSGGITYKAHLTGRIR